jgi:cytochrome c peroxidase
MKHQVELLLDRSGWRAAKTRNVSFLALLIGASTAACGGAAPLDENLGETQEQLCGRLENNVPFPNTAGAAATFSTAGFVDLENEFHAPQGRNGRSCAT